MKALISILWVSQKTGCCMGEGRLQISAVQNWLIKVYSETPNHSNPHREWQHYTRHCDCPNLYLNEKQTNIYLDKKVHCLQRTKASPAKDLQTP